MKRIHDIWTIEVKKLSIYWHSHTHIHAYQRRKIQWWKKYNAPDPTAPHGPRKAAPMLELAERSANTIFYKLKLQMRSMVQSHIPCISANIASSKNKRCVFVSVVFVYFLCYRLFDDQTLQFISKTFLFLLIFLGVVAVVRLLFVWRFSSFSLPSHARR